MHSDKNFEIIITKKSLFYVKDILEKDLYEDYIPSFEEISKVSEILSLSCNSVPINTSVMLSFSESINGNIASERIADLVDKTLSNASENNTDKIAFPDDVIHFLGKKECIYGRFRDTRCFVIVSAKFVPSNFGQLRRNKQDQDIVCFHSSICNETGKDIWNISNNSSVFSPFFDLTLNQINSISSAINNNGCIELKKQEMISKGIRSTDDISENESVKILFGSVVPFHNLLENIYKL